VLLVLLVMTIEGVALTMLLVMLTVAALIVFTVLLMMLAVVALAMFLMILTAMTFTILLMMLTVVALIVFTGLPRQRMAQTIKHTHHYPPRRFGITRLGVRRYFRRLLHRHHPFPHTNRSPECRRMLTGSILHVSFRAGVTMDGPREASA